MLRSLIEAIQDGVKISIRADITISPDTPKGNFMVSCEYCAWSYPYSSTFSAKRGLENHLKTCEEKPGPDNTVNPDDYPWIAENDSYQQNGDVR